MEKIDRRIKRTQKMLQEALISLTLEKGFDAVTIRNITNRADVGYTTFFRHYPDKEALLADVLNSMRVEFLQLLMPHSITTNPERMGTLLFQYVTDNADLCRVLLNSTNTMVLLRPMQEMSQEEAEEMFANVPGGDIPSEIAANHLIISLVMLIRWWLENGMPYPPERMGNIAASLIIRPSIEALNDR
jgi:AcrR family transcriptional regulator